MILQKQFWKIGTKVSRLRSFIKKGNIKKADYLHRIRLFRQTARHTRLAKNRNGKTFSVRENRKCRLNIHLRDQYKDKNYQYIGLKDEYIGQNYQYIGLEDGYIRQNYQYIHRKRLYIGRICVYIHRKRLYIGRICVYKGLNRLSKDVVTDYKTKYIG